MTSLSPEHEDFMRQAIEVARQNLQTPFGSVLGTGSITCGNAKREDLNPAGTFDGHKLKIVEPGGAAR